MKNIISKIIILLVLAMLTGCAAPKQPSYVEYVSSPKELNFIKNGSIFPKKQIKISFCKSIYNKACTKEQIALAEAIRQHIITLLQQCGNTYKIVEHWQDADVVMELPITYLGRSKDTAYKNAVPVSTMLSLANKPGQYIANELTQEIAGRSVRGGAASSMAGILFMAYDLGAFAVDGLQAIGHLYANCTIDIVDRTPLENGKKVQRFRTTVAATIDLESDDRTVNVAKFIPIFADPLLPLFINEQMCKPAIAEGEKIEKTTDNQ